MTGLTGAAGEGAGGTMVRARRAAVAAATRLGRGIARYAGGSGRSPILAISLTTLALGINVWVALTVYEDLTASADDLTENFQIDVFQADQVERDILTLAFMVGSHAARGEAVVPRDDLFTAIDVLWSRIDLVGSGTNGRRLQNGSQIAELTEMVRSRLEKIERDHMGSDDDPTVDTAAILGLLHPAVKAARALALDMLRTRLDLAETDTQNIRALVDNSRLLMMASIVITLILIIAFRVESAIARRAGRAAAESESRFRSFAQVASDWLWETDAAGRIIYMSEHAQDYFDLPIERLKGTEVLALAKGMAHDDVLATFSRALENHTPFRDLMFERRRAARSGNCRVFRLSGEPWHRPDGSFGGFRGSGTDITAEVENQRRIRHMAEHDQLTGLPNRFAFKERLRHGLGQDGASGSLVLMALDLDGFKAANDTHGHDIGDQLLIAAGRRIAALLRPDDMVARIGGDEFAILQRVRDDDTAFICQTASRLVAALGKPFEIDGFEIVIGLSIGIACAPADTSSAKGLIKAADLALYSAKRSGRGRFEFYRHELNAVLEEHRRIEGELRRAIDENALDLAFQPQFDLTTGALVGAEALVRWRHPVMGQVPPDRFIPIAEETGLIIAIGDFVLDRACAEARRWSGNGLGPTIAVNVSAAQFLGRDLEQRVAAALARHDLPAHRLEIEITESLLLKDTDLAVATLERLEAMGVRLAIDDFGTGYSSLSYLKRFRVNRLKIDRAFIADLEDDEDDRSIVAAILSMSRSLGLETIAEGVETPAQADHLRELGCDLVQGFHFGRPMPATDFRTLLADHATTLGKAPLPA